MPIGEKPKTRWKMVGTAGFEPATPRPPGVCATGLRHTPPSISGAGYRKSACAAQAMFAGGVDSRFAGFSEFGQFGLQRLQASQRVLKR